MMEANEAIVTFIFGNLVHWYDSIPTPMSHFIKSFSKSAN